MRRSVFAATSASDRQHTWETGAHTVKRPQVPKKRRNAARVRRTGVCGFVMKRRPRATQSVCEHTSVLVVGLFCMLRCFSRRWGCSVWCFERSSVRSFECRSIRHTYVGQTTHTREKRDQKRTQITKDNVETCGGFAFRFRTNERPTETCGNPQNPDPLFLSLLRNV